MQATEAVGDRFQSPRLRRQILVRRVRAPHDQRQLLQRRVRQLLLLEDGVKAALGAVVTQFHARRIERYLPLEVADLRRLRSRLRRLVVAAVGVQFGDWHRPRVGGSQAYPRLKE